MAEILTISLMLLAIFLLGFTTGIDVQKRRMKKEILNELLDKN